MMNTQNTANSNTTYSKVFHLPTQENIPIIILNFPKLPTTTNGNATNTSTANQYHNLLTTTTTCNFFIKNFLITYNNNNLKTNKVRALISSILSSRKSVLMLKFVSSGLSWVLLRMVWVCSCCGVGVR